MSVRRALAAAALAAAAIVLSRATSPPAAARLTSAGEWPVQVRGVFHLHTRRSDGTGSVERVAGAAARAGLRFAIITDHGDGARQPDPPAYRSGVLCIDAVEVSTSGGHLAAIGLGATPYPLGGEPSDVVEDVRRFGGFGIVTHPDSPRDALAWRGSLAGADGIEWLNGDSEWRDERWHELAAVVFHYPWRPAESIARTLDAPRASLRRWDEAARRRPVVALGGNDAHGGLSVEAADSRYQARPVVRVPSYEASLGALSLLVMPSRPLTGEAAGDARLVIDAIREGRVATVIDGFATPARFAFAASSGGSSARPGERILSNQPVRLRARSNAPPGATTILLRDGEVAGRWTGASIDTQVGPERAAYRVEVHLSGRAATGRAPWLVGNPIYVGYAAGEASVGDSGREPRGAPLAVSRRGTGAAWLAEHDRRSTVRIENGSTPGAVAFTVELGPGPRSGQYGAAVLALDPRRVGQAARVRFTGSSDRPCRLSVQLRQPEGRDGRRWAKSVYLDERPREVSVAFADLRPADPGGSPAPDLSRIDTLLFALDTVNLAPGGRRSFRLTDLAVEARSAR